MATHSHPSGCSFVSASTSFVGVTAIQAAGPEAAA